MKTQIIVIHGGNAFNTYEEYLDFLKTKEIDFEEYKNPKNDWKGNLREKLGEDFEVIIPNMPNKANARYLEWKLWFEKFIPHFNSSVILIGHSLGGTFLAKYLSENKFPKKIKATFLVAPAYDDAHSDYSLADFTLPSEFENFISQSENIFLYGSEDDPVVPAANFEKFKSALPQAKQRKFSERGHFTQEELPELIKDIKELQIAQE